MSTVEPFASYCGAPPVPAAMWSRWNGDPVLIAALGLALVAALRVAPSRRVRGAVALGWAIGAGSLVSPLCALSVALFAARCMQHMILTAVVAPLLALGLPGPRGPLTRNPWPWVAALAATLWGWQAPAAYAATFRSDAVYWAMHLTTFFAALGLWRAVVHAPPERLGAATAALVATGGQMALLGAVLVFAPAPLYAPHRLTTAAWGLTPLADQQLGGAILWLPGGVIVAAALLGSLAVLLRDRGRTVPA